MSKEKQYLAGISTGDYIHPAEQRMKLDVDSGLISKGLDVLNDLSVSLIRRITLGRHIAVNSVTAPDIDSIVKDVCRILDYPDVPRVYICHQAAQTLFCAGTDQSQITLSDYLLEQYDADMLYFAFGNLISMFKSGHVKLVTVCSMMVTTPATAVFEMPLQAYLRAADLSSDRGGLLACQDFSAAVRCILWDAGIPVSETKTLEEAAMIHLAEAYIQSVEYYSSDWLEQISTGWKKLTMESMPHAYRLKELLDWYHDGYAKLMSQWN